MNIFKERADKIDRRRKWVLSVGIGLLLAFLALAGVASYNGRHDLAAECLLWAYLVDLVGTKLHNICIDAYNEQVDQAEEWEERRGTWKERMREAGEKVKGGGDE